jgi:hypothetical protein
MLAFLGAFFLTMDVLVFIEADGTGYFLIGKEADGAGGQVLQFVALPLIVAPGMSTVREVKGGDFLPPKPFVRHGVSSLGFFDMEPLVSYQYQVEGLLRTYNVLGGSVDGNSRPRVACNHAVNPPLVVSHGAARVFEPSGAQSAPGVTSMQKLSEPSHVI